MFLESSALQNHNVENAFQILVANIFDKNNKGVSSKLSLNCDKQPVPHEGESLITDSEESYASPRINLGSKENKNSCCN